MSELFKGKVKTLRYFLLGRRYFKALEALELGLSIRKGVRKGRDADGNTIPEFQHQVEIALYLTTIITSLLHPEETIIAALLHDTPEDYYVDHRLITEQFGQMAGEAIYLLDKNGKTEIVYFQGIGNNAIASVVKGADRMHNVRTMVRAFKPEKQVRYADEVRTLFFPMLKQGRRKFPQQTDAYENIKHILNIQIEMYDIINADFFADSTGGNGPGRAVVPGPTV